MQRPCTILRLFVAALFCAALCACAGNGEGLDGNGRPPDEAAQLPLVAEFDSIQAHVFTPVCTVCHAGANAPQGLRLDAANSFNQLVGVPSVEVPSILRVKRGDPDNSYLIQKLEGTASVGARMPLGGPFLPASTVAVMRQWITDGALRNPPAAGADFTLTSTAPANGEALSEAPERIMLGFSHELDATRADAATVRLERFDPANPDAPGVLVPAAVSVPPANPLALWLAPRTALAAGQYRVVLAGAYAGSLTDLAGRRPTVATETNGDQIVVRFAVGRAQ